MEEFNIDLENQWGSQSVMGKDSENVPSRSLTEIIAQAIKGLLIESPQAARRCWRSDSVVLRRGRSIGYSGDRNEISIDIHNPIGIE